MIGYQFVHVVGSRPVLEPRDFFTHRGIVAPLSVASRLQTQLATTPFEPTGSCGTAGEACVCWDPRDISASHARIVYIIASFSAEASGIMCAQSPPQNISDSNTTMRQGDDRRSFSGPIA